MDIEGIRKLNDWVQESDNIVFFGGAGVSTESGIPDFRSVDGLYHQKWKYPPEQILSHSFFERNPEEYYRFQSRTRRTASWLSWSRPASCAPSSRRISTVCIRQREAKRFWNCMAAFFAPTARAAASPIRRRS